MWNVFDQRAGFLSSKHGYKLFILSRVYAGKWKINISRILLGNSSYVKLHVTLKICLY